MARDRQMLGERVTEFLTSLRAAGGHVRDYSSVQSSDEAYHCLSIVVFYEIPVGVQL